MRNFLTMSINGSETLYGLYILRVKSVCATEIYRLEFYTTVARPLNSYWSNVQGNSDRAMPPLCFNWKFTSWKSMSFFLALFFPNFVENRLRITSLVYQFNLVWWHKKKRNRINSSTIFIKMQWSKPNRTSLAWEYK